MENSNPTKAKDEIVFRPTYTKGDEYLDPGADHETYGIDATQMRHGHVSTWFSKINVYGDAALRDRIIRLLNENA